MSRYVDGQMCDGCGEFVPAGQPTKMGHPGEINRTFGFMILEDYSRTVLCHERSQWAGAGRGLIGGQMHYWLCGPLREESEQERFVRTLCTPSTAGEGRKP